MGTGLLDDGAHLELGPAELLDLEGVQVAVALVAQLEQGRAQVGRVGQGQIQVIIEPGASVIRSTIRGPAIIGANTQVIDSYIGPFTSIQHDCRIVKSEIEHSIILEKAQIEDIPRRIEDSLIGRFVSVTKSPLKPVALRFVLGDQSVVGIL